MKNELLAVVLEPLYIIIMLTVMTFSFMWSFIPAVGSCQELLLGLSLPAWSIPVSHVLSLAMFSSYMALKAGKWAREDLLRQHKQQLLSEIPHQPRT